MCSSSSNTLKKSMCTYSSILPRGTFSTPLNHSAGSDPSPFSSYWPSMAISASVLIAKFVSLCGGLGTNFAI